MAVMISLIVSPKQETLAVDVSNNQTGTEAGLGAAAAGDARVLTSAEQQKSTMWKISVWAAKNDNVGHSEKETLMGDYYQFGSTFWLYRKSGSYPSDHLSTDWLCSLNKEEYLRGKDRTFRKGRVSELSYRMFAGESVGFDGKTDETRVPYVPNCGTVTGMTNERISSAMNAFFRDNANTSNVLINLAAKASGVSDYKVLLKKMINEGKFTVNGHKLVENQLNLIDPYRAKVNGNYEKEASCIAWVIMYEPVLRFKMSESSTADRYYVTASDVGALMCNGLLNFSSTSVSGMLYRFSPSYRKAHGISVTGDGKIVIDGKTYTVQSKNCTRPFFVNLANSVYLESKWLGYTPPVISNPRAESDDLWKITADLYGWYSDRMLERAGFGLRYQKSNVSILRIVKTVTNASGTAHTEDYSKLSFIIKDSAGATYRVNLDKTGCGRIPLRAGTYTIYEETVPGYENGAMTSLDLKLQSGDGGKYTFTIGTSADARTINVTNKYVGEKTYHKITVNYIDKYTGDLIYQNEIRRNK